MYGNTCGSSRKVDGTFHKQCHEIGGNHGSIFWWKPLWILNRQFKCQSSHTVGRMFHECAAGIIINSLKIRVGFQPWSWDLEFWCKWCFVLQFDVWCWPSVRKRKSLFPISGLIWVVIMLYIMTKKFLIARAARILTNILCTAAYNSCLQRKGLTTRDECIQANALMKMPVPEQIDDLFWSMISLLLGILISMLELSALQPCAQDEHTLALFVKMLHLLAKLLPKASSSASDAARDQVKLPKCPVMPWHLLALCRASVLDANANHHGVPDAGSSMGGGESHMLHEKLAQAQNNYASHASTRCSAAASFSHGSWDDSWYGRKVQETQGANMEDEKDENDLSSTLISNILALLGVSIEQQGVLHLPGCS